MKRFIYAIMIMLAMASVTSEYAFGDLNKQIKNAKKEGTSKIKKIPKVSVPKVSPKKYEYKSPLFKVSELSYQPVQLKGPDKAALGVQFTKKGLTYEFLEGPVYDSVPRLYCRVIKGDTVSVANIPQIIGYGIGMYGVLEIGPEAFAGNENLKKVFIPDYFRSIEADAFRGCVNLLDVSLPDSLAIDSTLFIDSPTVLIHRR